MLSQCRQRGEVRMDDGYPPMWASASTIAAEIVDAVLTAEDI
jgi:hypothetical protein